MHNYKEMLVWKKARILVKVIYSLTKSFPDDEKFGLISQMRRCSVSVPSNIAEGSGRSTDKDFSHFLAIALASAYELETQILLSFDLNYLDEKQTDSVCIQINEIQKMLFSFRKTLKK